MTIFNLKPDFAPLGEGVYPFTYSRRFAGGELDVKVSVTAPRDVTLTTRLRGSDDMMELFLATNALRALGTENIHVFFPYLPYARQDRIVRTGEAFGLQVFADLMNAQGYASVGVFDAHSDVGPALMRRSMNHSALPLVRAVLGRHPGALLVSPDAGAFKKVAHYATALELPELPAVATKVRAPDGTVATGALSPGNYDGRTVIIVDDICDGGRTFAALAPVLRAAGAASVRLAISHGIFSYGEAPLRDGGIDHVYTTDSIASGSTDFVTRFPLATLLSSSTGNH
jgi:ribose-phosphate pyrophosphokinase